MASRKLASLIIVLTISGLSFGGNIANFDDLVLDSNSYWNGSDGSGGFVSGLASFNNYYDTMWGFWSGFAYSNIKDPNTEGWDGQYSNITGDAQSGDNYSVAYFDTYTQVTPTIVLDNEQQLDGLYVTNDNYAYYSILKGDAFGKKFGGDTGDDPDWFLLTITGIDSNGTETGAVEFYLGDYRFEDNCLDYIVNTWEYVDLKSLGVIKSLEFTLSSSDTSSWGANTPLYFAIDTLVSPPTPLEKAIDNIERAVISKEDALISVETALAEEAAAVDALEVLLSDSNEKDELKISDVHKAISRLRLAILRQKLAQRTLIQSIDNLDSVLAILAYQNQQDDSFDGGFNSECERSQLEKTRLKNRGRLQK